MGQHYSYLTQNRRGGHRIQASAAAVARVGRALQQQQQQRDGPWGQPQRVRFLAFFGCCRGTAAAAEGNKNDESQCGTFAFGKARVDLESLLQKITMDNLPGVGEAPEDTSVLTTTFLEDADVDEALREGRRVLHALVVAGGGSKNPGGRGPTCAHGRLGEAVNVITAGGGGGGGDNRISHEDLEYLAAAQEVLDPTMGSRGSRKDLTEILVFFAGMSSSHCGEDEERLDRTEDFVRFLLQHCLPPQHATHKYEGLLRAVGLAFPDDFDALDAAGYRAAARRAIVEAIPVQLCTDVAVARALARAEQREAQNRPLPKVLPICKRRAADGGFGDGSAAASDEPPVLVADDGEGKGTSARTIFTETTASFDDLPDEILIGRIFKFVGEGQYRFIAGVNKSFQEYYSTCWEGHSKTTSFEQAVASTKRAEIFLSEATDENGRDILCETAAMHGKLQVLQWAHEQGCPWDEQTCAFAAKFGHWEVLQWAHQQGCLWDIQTCTYAAKYGHLAVLQLAHQEAF